MKSSFGNAVHHIAFNGKIVSPLLDNSTKLGRVSYCQTIAKSYVE